MGSGWKKNPQAQDGGCLFWGCWFVPEPVWVQYDLISFPTLSVFEWPCIYVCVCVCTTVQPVSVCEHETDLAAVMINGRNFQYWFHSDQSTRAQKRQSYLLLFSTRFRKGKKTEKSSQFLGLFLIVLHTYIFTAPLTLGNKPVVNSHKHATATFYMPDWLIRSFSIWHSHISPHSN